MKKVFLAAYGGYFLGVFAMGLVGWWWWSRYGSKIDATDVTVVTGNNGHHPADMAEQYGR